LRPSVWKIEHVDYLKSLNHQELNQRELSTLMSKRFGFRITASHIGALLTKMRTPGHEFYCDFPYKSGGVRRNNV
jgi:hypothetical protein